MMRFIENRLSGRFAASCVIFVFAVAIYFNTLFNGFVFDDHHVVLGNALIKDVSSIGGFFFFDFMAGMLNFSSLDAVSNYYRPVPLVVWTLEHWLYSGFWAPGYHLLNIAVHGFNAVLLFNVSRILLQKWEYSDGAVSRVSCLAALLFAAHPVVSEAVVWVCSLSELLYVFFFLLSFYFYMDCGKYGLWRISLSVLFYFTAMLCKEPAFMLPLFIVAYDYSIRHKVFSLDKIKVYAFYAIAAVIYLILRVSAISGFVPTGDWIKLTVYEKVLSFSKLLFILFGKLVWPVNLSVFHEFVYAGTVKEPVAFAAVSACVLLLAAVIYSALRRRPIFFLLLWLTLFVVPLFPVIAKAHVVAERFLYMSTAGFSVLAALFLSRTADIFKDKSVYGRIVWVCAAAILLVFAVATVKRTFVWRSDLTLWQDAFSKNRVVCFTTSMLADAYYDEKRYDEALYYAQLAYETDASCGNARFVAADVFLLSGRPDKAEEVLLATTRDVSKSNLYYIYYYLGKVYLEKGDGVKAAENFEYAMQLLPPNDIRGSELKARIAAAKVMSNRHR